MNHAIKISQLNFSYEQTQILHIHNLAVLQGESVFLYGPSGSGKSTLLELLAGVLQSQSGELVVANEKISDFSPKQLDQFRALNLGYIFQSFNLVPYLTVQENIELPFLFSKSVFSKDYFNHLIEQLGLAAFINRPVSKLSVGQQQRVAVARALIKKPKVILADEPTSALDYNHREKFLKVLFELCRENKTTLVFVSHDLTLAKQFDRSINLTEINEVKFRYE